MSRLKNSIVSAFAGMTIAMSQASAQTPPPWQATTTPATGSGAEACTHAGSEGDVFCFGLRCAADGMPEWFIHQVGGDSAEGDVAVSLVVDGRSHVTLPMTPRTAPAGEWSLSAAFDPVRDRSALDMLKGGAGLYVVVGGVSGAHLSLRGSSRQIETTLASCTAGGQPAAPAAAINDPHGAVLALAARQGCEATESEIFNAITQAGFGAWDANLFVTNASENGKLQLIDRTDLLYRVAGCTVEKDAMAVDPDATELTLTSNDLPPILVAAMEEIATMCGDAYDKDEQGETALMAEDIDGDGIYDFLLDHVQFCPSRIVEVCGASHCPMTLLVSNGGTWRQFDYNLQGYREFSKEGFLFQCDDASRKAGVFMENGALTERGC